jgi:hypothetical protein
MAQVVEDLPKQAQAPEFKPQHCFSIPPIEQNKQKCIDIVQLFR